MSYKEPFSDSDLSESGEDFSASEDDWQPGKDDGVSEEDYDDDFEREDEENIDEKKTKSKKVNKPAKVTSKSPKKLQNSSLRAKLYRKYKPPPKTVRTSSSARPPAEKASIPNAVSNLLSNSEFKQKKKIPSSNSSAVAESESESSGDENLVDPKHLDLSSSFFTVNKSSEVSSAPSFDCNAGMKLSDSSGDDDDDDDDDDDNENAATSKPLDEQSSSKRRNKLIDKINKKSSNEVRDFSELQEFNRNLEAAKEHMKKAQEKSLAATKNAHDDSDITKLLSLGEGTSASGSQKRKKTKHESDGSDWENVSDEALDENGARPIRDIEITVAPNVARTISRDKQKAIDLEACLKRRLNRDIKERQVYLHKVSVLGWIAFGNYINRILNNMTLMQMCLKLLPSTNAYPKGDTDVKYFQSITTWFNSLFDLKSKKLYCSLKKLPPLKSLALQIQKKHVICRKDFVLLFVVMLRAIGIQCRLIINFPVLPIRPPQNELFVVSTKTNTEEENSKIEQKNSKEKIQKDPKKESKKDDTNLAKKIKVAAQKVSDSSKKKHTEEVPKKTKAKPSTSSDVKTETITVRMPNDTERTEKILATTCKVKLNNLSNSFIEKHTGKSLKHEPSDVNKEKQKTTATKNTEASKSSKTTTKSSASVSNQKHASNENSKSTESKIDSTDALVQKSSESPRPKKKLNLSLAKLTTNTLSGSKRVSDSPTQSGIFDTPTKIRVLEQPNSNSTTFAGKNKNTVSKAAKGSTSNAQEVTSQLFSPMKTRSHRNIEKNINAKAEVDKKQSNKGKTQVSDAASAAKKVKFKVPQIDGANNDEPRKAAKPKRSAKASSSKKNVVDADSSDSDFAPSPPKRIKSKPNETKSKHFAKKGKRRSSSLDKSKRQAVIDKRVFSTDDENDEKSNTEALDFWVEAYSEKEKKWITIDPTKKKVGVIDHVRKSATKPILYVLAWNNDNSLRDVSPRYCTQWHTVTRKRRAEREWFELAIRRFVEKRNPRTIIEDVEFSKLHMDSPLPKSISEFKDHPLYALERHLLKFQAIYPPDALTLGFIRNEPIFARECVHTLHSREIWVKQARVVKVGEKPYKIVKARPKWDRVTNQVLEAGPLEIFGYWQTEPYQPPVAQNGIVPRNAYGNVELFKPEMLPIGTRHLQLPGLNRVCKKLNVDCAQAVIGFDYHSGGSHPMFDGFIVCEEFATAVIDAWEAEQDEMVRKEREKREARVYGNWKKLIKGLLIRERLKRKFNFGTETKTKKSK